MGKKGSIPVHIALALLVLSSVHLACADPIAIPPVTQLNYVFEIDGDGGFTAENGVRSGIGTASDPYIIDGLSIAVSIPGIGLYVHSTQAFFVVENVNVVGGSIDDSYGIVLLRTSNATVKSCTVSGVHGGITVLFSQNVTITADSVSGASDSALSFSVCRDLVIQRNSIKASECGIDLIHATRAQVDHNQITSAEVGVRLYNCERVLAHDNTFRETTTPYTEFNDPGGSPGNILQGVRLMDQTLGKTLIFAVVVPACAALGIGAYFVRWRPKK